AVFTRLEFAAETAVARLEFAAGSAVARLGFVAAPAAAFALCIGPEAAPFAELRPIAAEAAGTLAERLAAAAGAARERARRALGLRAGDGFGRDGLADVVFSAAHLVALGVRGQRVGLAVAAGAARAADTVHVVFGLHGQVEVDRVADALHV